VEQAILRPPFIIVLALIGMLISANAAVATTTIPDYSKSYDPARDPFIDGKNALQYAQQSNRRVLIELGGNWCAHCMKLDRFIATTPAVKELLYRNFVVLKINVSDENDNREFRQGLPATFGYPHIFIADSKGSILYSKDTTQLLEQGSYSAARFIEFLRQWATTSGVSQ
jgi:thioredoxin-related protein